MAGEEEGAGSKPTGLAGGARSHARVNRTHARPSSITYGHGRGAVRARPTVI